MQNYRFDERRLGTNPIGANRDESRSNDNNSIEPCRRKSFGNKWWMKFISDKKKLFCAQETHMTSMEKHHTSHEYVGYSASRGEHSESIHSNESDLVKNILGTVTV